MKTLLKIIFWLIVAVCATVFIFGCNPAKRCAKCPKEIEYIEKTKDSISYIEKFIEKINPQDSCIIDAWMKCDSLGNVYLTMLNQKDGSKIKTVFKFKDNKIQIKALTDKVTERDKIISKYEKSSTDKAKLVQIKVYECISWWHKLFKWGFLIESCLLILIFIFLFLKWKYYDAMPFTKIN